LCWALQKEDFPGVSRKSRAALGLKRRGPKKVGYRGIETEPLIQRKKGGDQVKETVYTTSNSETSRLPPDAGRRRVETGVSKKVRGRLSCVYHQDVGRRLRKERDSRGGILDGDGKAPPRSSCHNASAGGGIGKRTKGKSSLKK